MNIEVITPKGKIYQAKEATSVTIPTTEGVITVMEDHDKLIALLAPGLIEINFLKQQSAHILAISKGILKVLENNVTLLADTAERSEEIDLKRALTARKRAQRYLEEQENLSDVEFAKIQAQIEKETARIHVAKKYKKFL